MEAVREPGRLELYCGPMFSGKTEELIRQYNRRRAADQTVLLFKYAADRRHTASQGRAELLSSHGGATAPAVPVSTLQELEDEIRTRLPVACVCVDETQMLALPQLPEEKSDQGAVLRASALLKLVEWLRYDLCVDMVLAGLSTDWQRHTWPWLLTLQPFADTQRVLTAICRDCKKDGAIYSRRLTASRAQVEVGGAESYAALCDRCWWKRDQASAGQGTITTGGGV